MAILSITEMEATAVDGDGHKTGWCGPIITTQSVTYTPGTSASSAVLNARTRLVRLCSDTAGQFRIGTGTVTAVATDPLLPANSPEIFQAIGPSQKVAIR